VSPDRDDLGRAVAPRTIHRVVSLVPSLTEAVAATAPGLLVGVTDWCTHPPDLAVQRVGGTKNPSVAAVLDLQPDLVLANQEENRAPDLDALRAAGSAVWVTAAETVPAALRSLERMLAGSPDRCPPDRYPPDRYPKVRLDDLPTYDLVVLPDEPYPFAADDGPEAFPGAPAALVSGRRLTWYGPSLVQARALLSRQLDV
jgi:hypothetical protein